jgi:hypothetical protein
VGRVRYGYAVTSAVWILVAWILVGAAFMVLHMVALWQALRAHEVAVPWRLAALLPPATPVVAWMGGARVAPVLWGVVLVAYVVLRLAGA